MKLYSYSIKLFDPLFFAREGISGAFTPPYIHATALNHAVTWAMGKSREDQSYFMTEGNGGRNKPRYKSSLIDSEFYLTPARLNGTPNYYTEIVKGDGDKTIQLGYGGLRPPFRGKNEILKAYRIYCISPESVFEGYLHSNIDAELFPKLIRLGSFRGVASFTVNGPLKVIGKEKQKYCDHAVDPLVSEVLRGIPVPMLPYPVVDQAMASEVLEIRKFGQRMFVASVPIGDNAKVEPIRNGPSLII
ncbi:MAG: type I-D CRISPR-associated protein Cas5/Csc1 [Nitrospiraceae bacterium]|nr:type I-D CRISPR-associated protein Cas5/Csc1 [Nitrospiraceae bacterium]